ncbi:hypothetical protein XELAEV_18010451mg [Xenopus laevis]|uniref:Ubiquitin-like protease family profile domain-containing protein n=1 Tax=Xenopus laevis TaxID=8355 RepID=A0A974DVD7_XENLA|nr:hypothetical protein XELAEV_18010451mg [Xenopus laevis]
MASTGNISFFRRILNPFRKTCIMQIFNCLPKHNKNRKETSTDKSEVIVQACSKEEELNKDSTTCIKEEERQIARPDSNVFENQSEPSIISLMEKNPKRKKKRGKKKQNRNDDWIPELNLKQQHKNKLQGTELLDDAIIDAAQNLLKKQFNCEGLQSSLFSKMQFYPVYGPSVQIHHDRKNWLTSCLKPHHVEIADSSGKRYLTDTLKKQIRECYGGAVTCDPVKMTAILDVDQQPNRYDCGVYAIANAYEFLANGNPTCKYDNKEMRKHLSHCFERREITAFPKIDSLPWNTVYHKSEFIRQSLVKTSQSIYSPRDISDGILKENFQLEIG